MSYEKIKNFLNDEENGLIVRLGMVLLGIILGTALILLALLFDKGNAARIAFLIFGYVTYGCFLIAAGVWYGDSR